MKKFFSGRAVFVTLVLSFLSAASLHGSAQAGSASGASANQYTVTIPGDSLSKIAGRMCGNLHYWKSIAQANNITVAPYWVDLNQTIVVPCMKPAPAPLPVVNQEQVMPALQTEMPIKVPAAAPRNVRKPMMIWLRAKALPHPFGIAGIAFMLVMAMIFHVIVAVKRRRSKSSQPYTIIANDTQEIPASIAVSEMAEEVPEDVPAFAETSVPALSAPIVMAPRLIDPELAALQDAVTSEIPAVAFIQNGIVCFAKFEPNLPFETQRPTVFVHDASYVDFLLPCEWDKYEVRVQEILGKNNNASIRRLSVYETAG